MSMAGRRSQELNASAWTAGAEEEMLEEQQQERKQEH